MAGTMRKRGKDSWYLEVTIGTDFRGKPIRYSRTVHGTKKQAEKELAKFYTECEEETCITYLHRLRAMQTEWKFSVGSKWKDTRYLLVNEFGEPIFPRNPSRWFIDFIEKLDGVHRITFHQLRHTHVALLAHLGTDIHKISKKVGHSEETTTLRTYMHILEKTEHEDAKRIDLFYQKTKV